MNWRDSISKVQSIFEHADGGFRVTNFEFVGAMREAGYDVSTCHFGRLGASSANITRGSVRNAHNVPVRGEDVKRDE